MLTFAYVEMNLFALAVLLLVYLNVSHRTARYLTEQKLFFAILFANALLLILDTGMWVLDGKPGLLTHEVYYLITAGYYIMNPIVCMIWSFYADYQVFRDEERLKNRLWPMLFPAAVNAFLTVLNFFGSYTFVIDSNNVYHRGPLFLVMAVICYAYLMGTQLLIVRNRDRIQSQYFFPILAFAFPPFLGGIVQTFFYGVSLIWVCMTISVLILFIHIQNDQLYTDHLTGLFNRRQLDNYLQQRLRRSADKGHLAGIMIDLDAFKKINDRFGHHVGDQALKHTADILRSTFRHCDFIARFGGDEFVVIMEARDRADLSAAITRLNEHVHLFNARRIAPYSLQLSIGYEFFDDIHSHSDEDFISRIDRLMYQDKLHRNIASDAVEP